ncbi:MAG: hypothetical protein LKH27_08245 [Prevotella sp.]|jgi:hypothetical protein|nr:hypothetical protein [Prevotella sp.]MCH3993012.1 hypothetical protein [Prevotella sp.]MCI1474387.1 hypothetical protein [Prevotella sp.]MCI1596058.1 hypothetical protein [Prevotella sp.]
MVYDLGNNLQVGQAKMKLDRLIKKKAIIDLTEHRQHRSLPQNSYLHLLLGYFASQTGNTLEWVKRKYYKELVNPTIFIREKQDPFIGAVKYLRSSADLDTEEMSTSIDRFKNWSAQEAEIYLPDAENPRELAEAQIEIERNKTFI